MYLVLEVVSPNGAALGENRRKVVRHKGARIGRAPHCDWVIDDPYVSKEHARITFVNGLFFVEALGRNPVAINRADEPIAHQEPHMLRSGDRLFIDQYEILVGISQSEPAEAAGGGAARGAPWAGHAADHGGPSLHAALPPDAGAPLDASVGRAGVVDGPAPSRVDPLVSLGIAPEAPQPSVPAPDVEQAPALSAHYAPPRAASKPAIPANWNSTNFEPLRKPSAPVQSPAAAQTPAPQTPAAPTPAVQPPAMRPPVAAQPHERARAGGPPPAAPSPLPSLTASPGSRFTGVPDEARPSLHASTARAPASPSGAASVTSPTSATSRLDPATSSVALLIEGAGLPAEKISPEILRDLGQVLRIVVQGVMDVLQARTDIKTQFRLPLTRVQSSLNNPLKFSPNVETALHTLLVERNPAYLGTTQAFEDAFQDIRHHQMAMLEGVREAFDHMLATFDPERLDKEFERGSRRGVLGLGGKAKFREQYAERFAALTSDRDESFRRLFGDCFGEAYEKQLEQLKARSRQRDGE